MRTSVKKSINGSITDVMIAFAIFGSAVLPMPADASWGYSLAAKLAIFDGIEEQCRPLVPELYEELKDKLPKHKNLTPSELKNVRMSSEYFEALEEVRRVMNNPATREGRSKIEDCRNTLEPFRSGQYEAR